MFPALLINIRDQDRSAVTLPLLFIVQSSRSCALAALDESCDAPCSGQARKKELPKQPQTGTCQIRTKVATVECGRLYLGLSSRSPIRGSAAYTHRTRNSSPLPPRTLIFLFSELSVICATGSVRSARSIVRSEKPYVSQASAENIHNASNPLITVISSNVFFYCIPSFCKPGRRAPNSYCRCARQTLPARIPFIVRYHPRFLPHFANMRRRIATCALSACPLPQTVRPESPDVSP
jgi:hypothetical protein